MPTRKVRCHSTQVQSEHRTERQEKNCILILPFGISKIADEDARITPDF